MKSLFLCSLFIFLGWNADAKEVIWKKSQSQSELVYVLFNENGFWNLNLYSVAPGRLQDLQWHKAFSTEKKARSYLGKHLSPEEMRRLLQKNESNQNYAFTEDATHVIWEAENVWSWEWEAKYAEWLHQNYTREFFQQNNIQVDCADNATAIRWIFSRIHKLPAGNTLAGTGVVFTNESMKEEWRNFPIHADWRQDKRFLKALDYVLDNTYTHSVFKDGYPIGINKDSFLAGTYMISLQGDSGHTRVISYVSYEANGQAPIRVLESGAPRRLQILGESPFWEQQPVKQRNALLKPRWPIKINGQWSLVAAEKMPHYSLEQFDVNFSLGSKDFTLAVYKRLMPGFDPVKLVSEGFDQIIKKFLERNRVVNEGYEFCKLKGCPEGTAEWEAWSTPMRDNSLLNYFNGLEKTSKLIGEINNEAKNMWIEGITLQEVPVMTFHRPSLKQLLFIWRYGLFDSNPNVPPLQRWALDTDLTAAAMTDRIKRDLGARVEKIEQNSCKNCVKDSVEWKASNTYKMDSDVQRYYIGVIQYCYLDHP